MRWFDALETRITSGFERRDSLPDTIASWRLKGWWARKDLNLGPTDYESAALTAELRALKDLLHIQACLALFSRACIAW